MTDTLRLLAEARDGSPSSFDALFQRHRGRLATFAASRMGPALRGFLEPEDIVQETYLEAARKIDEFEAREPQGFYRWLVRIAGFKVKEANRRRQAKKRGQATPRSSDSRTPRSHGGSKPGPPARDTCPLAPASVSCARPAR